MSKVVGKVSKTEDSRFEWRLSQFSTKNRTVNINSPTFQFWDAAWKLEIYYNYYGGEIFFSLIRDAWKHEKQSVVFQLSATGLEGRKLVTFEGGFEFTEFNNECKSSLKEEDLLIPKEPWNFSVFCVFYKNGVIPRAESGRISPKNEQKYTEVKGNSMKKDIKIGDATEKSPKLSDVDKLVADLKNLLCTEEDSDVSIKVKDREFKAHKIILRARSSVFYSMFKHDMAEKSSGTVEIVDCDPEAFQKFLQYLYTGHVGDLSNDIAIKLYCVADKYDAEEVKIKCVKFMTNNLSVDAFCGVVALALKHNESALLNTATEYFCRNVKDIIVTAQWQSFMKVNTVVANELHIKAVNYYVIRN